MTQDELKDHLDAAIRGMSAEDLASIRAAQHRAEIYDRAARAPGATAADRDRLAGYSAIARGAAVQKLMDASREIPGVKSNTKMRA